MSKTPTVDQVERAFRDNPAGTVTIHRAMWQKVKKENKAKVERVSSMLRKMKRGIHCWCDCGIGSPMMGGRHSQLCKEIQEYFENPEEEPTPEGTKERLRKLRGPGL